MGGGSEPQYISNEYGESMRDALQAQIDLAPQLYKAESDPNYGRKAYARLDQEIIEESLLGETIEYDSEGRQVTGYSGGMGGRYQVVPQVYEKHKTDEGGRLLYLDGDGQETTNNYNWNTYNPPATITANQYRIIDIDTGKDIEVQGSDGKFSKFTGTSLEDAFAKVKELGGGDLKPIYKKNADGEVIRKPEMAGKTTREGGALDILGGKQPQQFSDGTTRRAGFNEDGSFAGTSKMEQDLLELAKKQQINTEADLAKTFGKELTDAYRGNFTATQEDVDAGRAQKVGEKVKGSIQKALDETETLAKKSAFSDDQKLSYGDKSLFGLASQFQTPQITSPTGNPRPTTPPVYTDPAMQAQENLRNAGKGIYDPQAEQDAIIAKYNTHMQDIANGETYISEAEAQAMFDQEMSDFDARQQNVQNNESVAQQGANSLAQAINAGNGMGGLGASQMYSNQGQLAQGLNRVNSRGVIADAVAGRADTGVENTATIADASQGNMNVPLKDMTEQAQGSIAPALGDMGGLRSAITADAVDALALGGNLSDREARRVTEDARIASTARGRGRDLSAILGEVNANEGARRQRLNERRQYAQGALGQEGAFRQDEAGRQTQTSMQNAQLSDAYYNRKFGYDQQYNQLQDQKQARELQASMANQGRDIQQANLDMQAKLANQGATQNLGARESQASMANQQADIGIMQTNMQGDLANQRAELELKNMEQQAQAGNAQSELARQQMLFNALQLDYQNQQALDQYNSQMAMQGLGMDRAFLQSRVGLEQATSADGLLAVTGRTSGASVGTGQGVYGNGAVGLNSAPQLYNPAQGAQFMADQTAGQNNFNANIYGSNQQRIAGMYGAIGSAFGKIGSAMIPKPGCWVAREVYGETNPQWLLFRAYLFSDAPSWFRKLYLKFGERFAEFISTKPRLKSVIKKWMDTKIKKG